MCSKGTDSILGSSGTPSYAWMSKSQNLTPHPPPQARVLSQTRNSPTSSGFAPHKGLYFPSLSRVLAFPEAQHQLGCRKGKQSQCIHRFSAQGGCDQWKCRQGLTDALANQSLPPGLPVRIGGRLFRGSCCRSLALDRI